MDSKRAHLDSSAPFSRESAEIAREMCERRQSNSASIDKAVFPRSCVGAWRQGRGRDLRRRISRQLDLLIDHLRIASNDIGRRLRLRGRNARTSFLTVAPDWHVVRVGDSLQPFSLLRHVTPAPREIAVARGYAGK